MNRPCTDAVAASRGTALAARRRGRGRVRADACRSPPTPARRAAPRPCRRWSSSTPPKAATPARRPTAGCRSSRPTRAWSRSPSTSTTGTGSAGRTASPAPPSPPARRSSRRATARASATRRRSSSTARTARTGRASPCRSRNRPAAPVDVLLAREGDRVTATVAAGARSPKRLAAYWAVTEQGHVTAVKAGENQRRDAAARLRGARLPDRAGLVGRAAGAAQTLAFQLPARADAAARPREVNLVVVDADSGRPGAGAEDRLLNRTAAPP